MFSTSLVSPRPLPFFFSFSLAELRLTTFNKRTMMMMADAEEAKVGGATKTNRLRQTRQDCNLKHFQITFRITTYILKRERQS